MPEYQAEILVRECVVFKAKNRADAMRRLKNLRMTGTARECIDQDDGKYVRGSLVEIPGA